MEEVYDVIARRAYAMFEGRGRKDGHDREDWLVAEGESLKPTLVEISVADKELIIRTDLLGLKGKNIQVRVEPHRVIISGKPEEVNDDRGTHHGERKSNEVLRALDLPEEINPDQVKAVLHEGTLEITLPKARSTTEAPIQTKAA